MKAIAWPGRLLVAALLCLLLVLSIPAHWLGAAVAAASGDQLRLVDASGRWYDGRARLYVQPAGQDEWLALGRLRWRMLDAAGLIVVELERGLVTLNWADGQPELRAKGIVLPAMLLSGVLHEGIGGVLDIGSGTLRRVTDGAWRGEGKILWRSAALARLDDYPLGDVGINWQMGETLAGSFSGQLPNAHSLQGRFGYAPASGAVQASASLLFVDRPPERLALTLQRLGRQDPSGAGYAYHLEYP